LLLPLHYGWFIALQRIVKLPEVNTFHRGIHRRTPPACRLHCHDIAM
jgi:hypothetical protein